MSEYRSGVAGRFAVPPMGFRPLYTHQPRAFDRVILFRRKTVLARRTMQCRLAQRETTLPVFLPFVAARNPQRRPGCPVCCRQRHYPAQSREPPGPPSRVQQYGGRWRAILAAARASLESDATGFPSPTSRPAASSCQCAAAHQCDGAVSGHAIRSRPHLAANSDRPMLSVRGRRYSSSPLVRASICSSARWSVMVGL